MRVNFGSAHLNEVIPAPPCDVAEETADRPGDTHPHCEAEGKVDGKVCVKGILSFALIDTPAPTN